ncbi:MAG: UDP-galactose-lipid carrier transferase [Planctomycetes bacterium]|nr:UDP-galactose-lipid carrier transferase [Planctomycetota bacterium]
MALKLKNIDLKARLADKDEYEKRLRKAQLQLLLIQRHLYENKREAVFVFEGWDAAGKGGSIRRLVERLDPRGYVVHSIAAPSTEEKQVHYLQRFWSRMPGPGRVAIFDRSWYGRVLVERVESFATKEAWKRAYDEINAFERILVGDGVPVIKFFLHIDKDEQLKRFQERETNPFKKWKITEEDYRNRKKWPQYEKAIDDMFKETSTKCAPWHAVAANRKWHARVSVCETAVAALAAATGCETKLPKGWQDLDQ